MKAVVFVAVILLASGARAAPFQDPTQPPGTTGIAGDPQPSGPRVESILIAPDRRLAVINGEQVTVGSKVAGGAVVRITETDVVVRGADGEQTLTLFPGIRRSTSAPTKKGKSP